MVAAAAIGQNHVGEIEIALTQPIAADMYALNPRTGRVVLEFNGRIAGGGLILATDGPARAGHRTISRPLPRGSTAELATLSPPERIARFRAAVEGRIVFTTSFGLEDQVLTHQLSETAADIEIATLDTGRLFPETYELWAETERRYGRRVRAMVPQTEALEALVAKQGINGFYESREARLACCHVRKVEPLNRALSGARGWITGLRADQSNSRSTVELVSVDDERNLLKLSPLFDWTRDAALSYATTHDVPVNPLHARRICLDRLRALHPRDCTGRTRTRRPLVVGGGKQKGMRTPSPIGHRWSGIALIAAGPEGPLWVNRAS